MIDTTSMSIMANFIQPTSSTIASQMISKKDSDEDSNLSIDEMGISDDIFTSIDLDSNSLLSNSELSTAITSAMSQFNGDMPSPEEFQSMLSDFGFEAPSNVANNNSTLSDAQQEVISSVLENYDSSNLSKSDALEIVAAFKSAGIEPSSDLADTMEELGFDAKEVGSLAQVGPESGSGGGQGGSGGGGGGGSSSAQAEESFDIMDTNEDGVVSADEMAEYYGTSDDTQDVSTTEQNSLANIQLLMETLKANTENGSINANSFDGLLKTINNQNNNSQINAYLQGSSSTSSLFGYA